MASASAVFVAAFGVVSLAEWLEEAAAVLAREDDVDVETAFARRSDEKELTFS